MRGNAGVVFLLLIVSSIAGLAGIIVGKMLSSSADISSKASSTRKMGNGQISIVFDEDTGVTCYVIAGMNISMSCVKTGN